MENLSLKKSWLDRIQLFTSRCLIDVWHIEKYFILINMRLSSKINSSEVLVLDWYQFYKIPQKWKVWFELTDLLIFKVMMF